jgi:TP901 family phage tail tape measure protein
MIASLDKSAPAMNEAADKARALGQSFRDLSERAHDMDMLTSRLKYFFSMMGGFQLFKRAIRSAVNTIKELDAAMTETAVVSTKTVGEMWKTLPQYSKKAKELAASIKDVYSAQTLYVQQGLDMDSALNLGVETLKMARVAGIDAATATDTMTAALRGFKMELNEVSAQRVNDVYSKLAQNSASNVQELSTAMSKVAALANSANMSFENTAGFLAKIIESTREGAETAGTALKTVIARFSEVKKLYSEGELLSTDEEG